MGTLPSSFSLTHDLPSFSPMLHLHPKPRTARTTFVTCKAADTSNPRPAKIEPKTAARENRAQNPRPAKIERKISAREKTSRPPPLARLFDSLDELIHKHLDPPVLPPPLDPKLVLAGNFAPVAELPPTACNVAEGALPRALDGAYIRNGPNPQFGPRGPHHLFDGDGMLHCIRISGGRATLCSRFVETRKYQVEREMGSPAATGFFSSGTKIWAIAARNMVDLARWATGQYSGIGVANTSVARLGGKLFALYESDIPYRIKVTSDGDIITLGPHEDYSGPERKMTAHPKVDKFTGESFAFRCDYIRPPYLTYFTVDANGTKRPDVPIFSLKEACMIHDFALTKSHVIFSDSQIVIRPTELLKGKPPVLVDRSKVPRLGILPRHAADDGDMWWVEAPGFNALHMVNAWEEDGGDTIVLVAPNLLEPNHVINGLDLAVQVSMEMIEIDVKRKKVERRPVAGQSVDFAVINPAYVGKKTKYVYAAIVEGAKMSGVVKLDLSTSSSDCTVATRVYGPGRYGGESYFVPREAENPEADEDDGYLVNYVHDENTQESEFLVMDAKSPHLDIVAVVKLPQRVPYGFHGIFVPECQLHKL
ncbi:carotenoid cleavage dioxygenase 4 [Striga asiatica]|uniref:Carotenoid cleavage dioxygenase 4 n=1 Tax=Striga asiatica TaxID=4170 RepID=A0A5A7PBL8_STRAF|nr:carotenoid cleavage dioxygenase 4 [Striga asiatica]